MKMTFVGFGALLMAVSISSVGAERESGGRRAAMAVEVSFTSFGGGIDTETQDKILALVNEEIRTAQLAALTVTPWGKEGERNLCIQFADLVHAQKKLAEIVSLVEKGDKRTSAERELDCFGTDPKPNE